MRETFRYADHIACLITRHQVSQRTSGETRVGLLITQRSQVQIMSPLRNEMALQGIPWRAILIPGLASEDR
jgi:hypothetical protein